MLLPCVVSSTEFADWCCCFNSRVRVAREYEIIAGSPHMFLICLVGKVLVGKKIFVGMHGVYAGTIAGGPLPPPTSISVSLE